ncbi:hypothetical protein [Halosegnis sp.]|uniref:hypothetical protein n=1 Tax=Halosegnis sp. TaxID=2864959 RepID=UPI0035D4D78B
MCHHRTSDWYSERLNERADDESVDDPDYAEDLTGREVDEPEVADPEFEDSEVETPELADDETERPAATPSDD